MSALPIIITQAGLAALINAQNTGASGVTIASLGVSATQVAVTPATAAIPDEIKRLNGVAGQVVAADTFYISANDQSDDTYTVRTVALYLNTGVLFAAYSQAAPLVEKASPAMTVLEAAVKLSSPVAEALEFTGGGWLNPPASESVQGVLRLATAAEAIAGVNPSRAITPVTLLTVLNNRLGAGAPSAFMKGLLTTATAAAMRVALGLKSAALKDEGAGNGLDADTLDGEHGAYYRAWANLTGKPIAFTPTAHNHSADDITSGVFVLARLPTYPQNKVDGLPAALDAKADLLGATFQGNIGVKRGNAYTTFSLDAFSGQHRDIVFATNGSSRWLVRVTNEAESGGNAGSNLQVARRADDGSYIDIPFSIDRATGKTSLSQRPAFGAATPWDSANFDPTPLKYFISRSGAWSRHQTDHGWIDIGPANAEFAHFYTDRPAFYFNAPILVAGREVWHNLSLPYPARTDHANTFIREQAIETAAQPDVLRLRRTVVGDGANYIVFENQTGVNRLGVVADILRYQNRAGTYFDVYHSGNLPSATYAAAGAIEMATDAEALAGTDQTRAINPYVLKRRIDAAINDDALDLYWPAGELKLYDSDTRPTGARVVVANGAVVSRTTYARLFAVIGTRYGAGNGSTTFQLPDWRGVFFRGLDSGRGLDPSRALGVMQDSQNKRHNHSLPSRSNPDAGNGSVEDAANTGTAMSAFTGYEGGDEARPVNHALLACITY